MSSLYEMTANFEKLFNQYEDIVNYEFTPDGKGGFVNDDGEPVDPAAMRQEMSEAWFDTLDGMEGEIKEKAEAVGVYAKSLKSEYEAMEAEKKRLEARIRTKKNAEARMKQYLMDCLTAAKLKKIDMPRAVIFIRNNAESVEIKDEFSFIQWAENTDHEDLLKYSMPEVRKSEVKRLLQNNEIDTPYAELVRTQSVVVK